MDSSDAAPTHSSRNAIPKSSVDFNGRTYFADPTLPHTLPVDLIGLHRQSLRTLIRLQTQGALVPNPTLTADPPKRVLEMGCGSGLWSIMCHRLFRDRGFNDVEFVGLDIAPPGQESTRNLSGQIPI